MSWSRVSNEEFEAAIVHIQRWRRMTPNRICSKLCDNRAERIGTKQGEDVPMLVKSASDTNSCSLPAMLAIVT